MQTLYYYLELGNYYVVALNNSVGIDHGNGIVETPNDYVLWNCGEYWINFDNSNQNAKGYILKGKKKKQELQYAKLREKLRDQKSR